MPLEEHPRTGYACEGSTLTIDCARDRRIKILRANYGRFKRDVCNEGGSTELWDMQCMSTRSLRIVTALCDGKSRCSIPASNSLFGDTCSTTFKYVEVEYTCVTGKSQTPHLLRACCGLYPTRIAMTMTSTLTQHVCAC
ncbi:hypothetical protein NP493_3922g00000 [Ridgeia piscesae]|uniref:SUEL-type lectin domain-containing protein n=1 Tax=Ridgeia piscesae TaxID=27915 RepID=A0AAD9MVC3_RIDPI|nr:hypothetical protein NP493_3922g00000 [Ridgeia piscesae]